MIKRLTFLVFLLTFAFFVSANAQNAVTPEKQAAIKELLAIFNEDNSIEKLMEIMSAQSNEVAKSTFKRMLDEDKTLSKADREVIEELFLKDEANVIKRYNDKMLARLNLNQMIDEISIGIYEKHYTLEELRELLVFYKSPVGRKTLKLTPQIFAESMQVLMEKLQPKIMEAAKEIEEEMRKEFEEKIKAQKAQKKKSATK